MSPAFRHATVGTHQALYERDVFVAAAQKRIDHLGAGEESLIFGRIDTDDDTHAHIGRLGITDEAQESLVVDWRTPIAEPFYRATGRHPMGLRRRRHFLTEGGGIVELEDELFGDGDEEGLGLPGSAALLAALKRSRSGRMRDIVATVQREQDEIIRAPLGQVLVVEGGPGTGKTAVALHRAAYLLYTHHFPLDLQGVLVVGPNRQYLRYIEHVLPSLGENGVELATVAQLVGYDAHADDTHRIAVLKGDIRMAAVLARALTLRQRPLREPARLGVGAHELTIPVHESSEIVRMAKRRPGTHNSRRGFVERQILKRLHSQYTGRRNRLRELRPLDNAETANTSESVDFNDFADSVSVLPEFRTLLGRMWPLLTSEQFLHDLFSVPALLKAAAKGVFSPEEITALRRPRAESEADITWSRSDVPLLDEAAALLGPPRLKHPHDEAPPLRTFGHIVIDEAQDLSPMQLRVVHRRSLAPSMTIVGDLNQATGPWAPRSWKELTNHLAPGRDTVQAELTTNYRTPGEIMRYASRVLAVLGGVAPVSVRDGEYEPEIVATAPEKLLGSIIDAAALDQAAEEVEGELDGFGTVAVITPPSLVDEVLTALRDALPGVGDARRDGIDEPISVLPAELAKGLEFDRVVVVEPAAIVEELPQGRRSLYVALTRPTQHLTVIHARPLPAELTAP